jgi:transposase
LALLLRSHTHEAFHEHRPEVCGNLASGHARIICEQRVRCEIPRLPTIRKQPIPHDKELYRQRHRVEMMFGRLKDWRRIATRYDRCPTIFFGALTLAAIVIFWLKQ